MGLNVTIDPTAVTGTAATLGANTFTGAQAAPSLALGGATIGANALAVTGTAVISSSIQTVNYYTSSARVVVGDSFDIGLGSTSILGFTSANAQQSKDSSLSRISAGLIGVGTGAAGSFAGSTKATTAILGSANGATWTQGQASELLTLSTSGTTTDTSADLLPANSIIESVVARVTTAITTATGWQLGDPTTAGRFTANNATMAAGTTDVGLVHVDVTGAGGPRQTAAAKVRVTTTGTPGAGAIRITVFYRTFVAPTS